MTKIDINRNKEMIISLLRSTNRIGIDNVIANLKIGDSLLHLHPPVIILINQED